MRCICVVMKEEIEREGELYCTNTINIMETNILTSVTSSLKSFSKTLPYPACGLNDDCPIPRACKKMLVPFVTIGISLSSLSSFVNVIIVTSLPSSLISSVRDVSVRLLCVFICGVNRKR